MKTRLLLSSAVGGPNIEKAFQVANELNIGGLEVLAFRWTTQNQLESLSKKYGVEIVGIHFPFWWYTKSLWDVLKSEEELGVRGAIVLQKVLIGAGHDRCAAAKLSRAFPNAYCLIHPDTYEQLPNYRIFKGREVFLENERPKKGESKLTFDPYAINEAIKKQNSFKMNLMFDPRHIQIAQSTGQLKSEPLDKMYEKLKPKGMHLSFQGESTNDIALPPKKIWEPLRCAIEKNPPQYLILEGGFSNHAQAKHARKIVKEDLGL